MRILVYPHMMGIGGSQLNAVQLAGAVRDRGHDVVVLSEAGPMVERVRGLGLEHIELGQRGRKPSPRVARLLAGLASGRRLDVVHGYEWPPIVEAVLGLGLSRETAVIGTVMAMSVAPFLPRSTPLIVGTEQIRQAALAQGRRRVTLIEPPVDTESDHPGVDGAAFRARHGVAPEEVLVAMVCRLVPDLKLEGLLAACDAVLDLALSGHPVRLAIVGDGGSRAEVAERAARANAAAERELVFLTGEIRDPSQAYAGADITVGQGGSALRGMAYGKPLVVVGECGFSELLTPDTAPIFLKQGWYGLGPGSRGAGALGLRRALERLATSPGLRAELGSFARRLVVERFSLREAARLQEAEYVAAMEEKPAALPFAADMARSMSGLFVSKLHRKVQRWRGVAADDDTNALSAVTRVLRGADAPAGEASREETA
jgi:glycosyltransferase involved in cell wall biosynthesis